MSCKTKNCGCTDVGLITPSPCPCDVITCATPDICPETFSDSCIVHTGDTIVDLNILKGDRLAAILQKMVIALTQPLCVAGTACASALNFKSTAIGTTTASFSWDTVTGATEYTLEYRKTTDILWTANPNVITNLDSVTGLTAATNYYVRVNTVCGITNDCYSVTILITTNP